MKSLYSLVSVLLISGFALAQPNIPFPTAPDLTAVWQDDGMHLSVSNLNVLSNNYLESYAEFDSNIESGDSIWRFQGYMIYQVQIPIDVFNPSDPDVARLVVQTDIDDDIDDLYNSVYVNEMESCVTVTSVEGTNGGLASEFVVSSEMWGGEFVPGEVYCYVAMSYVANVNGEADDCPGLPYQFYPGVFSAAGNMLIQCATVSETVSVDSQEKLVAEISPNPVENVLRWNSESEISSVRVMSVLGSELLSIAGKDLRSVDLAALSSGVFLVEISSGTDRIVQRFMKN